MTYKIWIGVDRETGEMVVGKESLRKGMDTEQVYGSQLSHRVAVQMQDGKWRLGTPSEGGRQKGCGSIRYAYGVAVCFVKNL